MGCTCSAYARGRKKSSLSIPEVAVFVPSIRIPVQSDLQRALGGIIPRELADKLSSLRNQIVLVAEDTGGSAIAELRRTLNEYLAVLIGLTKRESSLEGLIEFKWKNFAEGRQDSCIANAWFEVISAVHLMAMLTLSEADSLMIPKDHSSSGIRAVSSENKREAVDLLLKASGYLEFCVKNVLSHMPDEVKMALPHDLQDGVLEAISIQALGQGTEIQLGLAVEDQKATLSVKRRLACEQVTYFSQAYHCLLRCDFNQGYRKKHIQFIKWKFLEAKAAAYYYHGLILDKGNEPTSYIGAVSCFLAADELLAESKKACLSFCLATPVTRAPPLWGVMKRLHKKIPEVAASKSQTSLQALPELPEFQLSLSPDDYQLPEMDPAWIQHLQDGEDEIPTD
ncbi:uncharacterized protein LOC129306200 isoform X2 [Prosopis cineraria]|uniref:uncharacterized protein LOC129306200 isoform X2 n=1 Tax=Prosopis cineraria TaxID=364024 RepID=UPI00240FF79C|nr:uncharacterized protein LOC129306200 isoform X2 [Prosopis cineraria]